MQPTQEDTPHDNIQHLNDCDGCERCDFLMGVYMACDGCGQWGHKDSSHQYAMRDGEFFCEKCTPAEDELSRVTRQRDMLLAALQAMLEHEGTTESTGIGEMPSEALEEARKQAHAVIAEVTAK